MEPAFYRCKACGRCWERMQYKMRANPPTECPSCGSTDQETDEEKEREYVKRVYGPIARALVPQAKPYVQRNVSHFCERANAAVCGEPTPDFPSGTSNVFAHVTCPRCRDWIREHRFRPGGFPEPQEWQEWSAEAPTGGRT